MRSHCSCEREEVPEHEDAEAGDPESRAHRLLAERLLGDRDSGGLVDRYLRRSHPSPTRDPEHGCHAEAVEAVANPEKRRGRDRAGCSAAPGYDSDGCKLGTSREGQEREKAALQHAESGGHAGRSEGEPICPDGQRDAQRVTDRRTWCVQHRRILP
jgi:hypothetical protein